MPGAALLEDGDLAQEADVVARIVLLQLLHGHRLDVPPLRPVHLRVDAGTLTSNITSSPSERLNRSPARRSCRP